MANFSEEEQCDPSWCFENPEKAAREIDMLNAKSHGLAELQIKNGQYIFELEARLAKRCDQIQELDKHLNEIKNRLRAFPTMLRKMWTGGEVKQWIDNVIGPKE